MDDAFDILLRALSSVDLCDRTNIVQALAATKHPQAQTTLEEHLESLWLEARLWDDDPFTNWFAYGATTCIAHLIELGVAPSEFEDRVVELSKHVCAGNRESCRNRLARYYSWLSLPDSSV